MPCPGKRVLFNRHNEKADLKRILVDNEPVGILVVVGPMDCGKTALIQSFLADLPETSFPSMALDGRLTMLTNGAGLFHNPIKEVESTSTQERVELAEKYTDTDTEMTDLGSL